MIHKIQESKAWFIGRSNVNPEGPLPVEKIMHLIENGKWLPTDWVCNPILDITWRQLFQTRHFPIEKLPTNNYITHNPPSLKVFKEIKDIYQPISTQSAANLWYLQFRNSKFGPLNIEECLRIIHSGQLKGAPTFVWKIGMQEWLPYDEVPELSKFSFSHRKTAPSESIQNRKTDRLALLSTCTIKFEDGSVIVGICHDVSLGGVLVVTEAFKSKGLKAQIEIRPVDEENINVIHIKAEVARYSKSPFGIGFKFLHPSTELIQLFEKKGYKLASAS